MVDSTGPILAILFALVAVIISTVAYNKVIPTQTFITAYSDIDQAITGGTAANVQHTQSNLSNGIDLVTGTGSYFQVHKSGIYKIIPSVVFLGGNPKDTLFIWLKVNGVNVPDSATATKYANGDEGVITTEYILQLQKEDTIQIWAFVAGGSTATIKTIAANATYPRTPGIITNMYALSFL
jgi:hypothetical protein